MSTITCMPWLVVDVIVDVDGSFTLTLTPIAVDVAEGAVDGAAEVGKVGGAEAAGVCAACVRVRVALGDEHEARKVGGVGGSRREATVGRATERGRRAVCEPPALCVEDSS